MDEELDRLFEAAKAADEAFRQHRLTGHQSGYMGGDTTGTATADRSTPAAQRAWRHDNDRLRDEARQAHEAWLRYQPLRALGRPRC